MRKKKFLRISLVTISLTLLVALIAFGSFYRYWNSASPDKTCASCHEIEKSVDLLSRSHHRDLACREYHGTALSNVIHSLKEKGMMVVHHAGNKFIEDIRLNESQVLDVMDHCDRCH